MARKQIILGKDANQPGDQGTWEKAVGKDDQLEVCMMTHVYGNSKMNPLFCILT